MPKPKIKPLSDYILVEPVEKETTLPSGIVIPDTAKEKPQEGRIVAVGPGRKEADKIVPMELKTGDIIIYKKWGGTEITSEGKEYLLVKEEDVLAIIES
jgi:chaperonin GroES